jgi:hypothetical protein
MQGTFYSSAGTGFSVHGIFAHTNSAGFSAGLDSCSHGVRERKEAPAVRGNRVHFDLATWEALDLLARDRMMTFQELADEAFSDLLRKHGRPTDLKDALRQSFKAAASRRPGQHRK